MQDVGLLCLSPGFQTQDPAKQQQLAKSMEMREQQRQLIESRLHQQATSTKDTENEKGRNNGDSPAAANNSNNNTFSKPPPSSKRKGPPPGLSINAPAPHQFASEPRVIQSAPINQSFTGLKPAPAHEHPLSRQVLQHTHHHNQYHGVAGQTNGAPQFAPIGNHPPNSAGQRLPPISDVIASQDLGMATLPSNPYTERDNRTLYAPHSNIAPLHSPGYPPPHPSAGLHPPPSAHFSSSRSRERDFDSADDAVQSLSGGREDLLPKIIHYGGGGHPAPPSSSPHHGANGHSAAAAASSSSQPQYAPITTATTSFANGTTRPEPAARTVSGTNRRRNRDEYEADLPIAADAMDVDGGPRGRVSQHARQRARMEDREDRERGAAAYFDEAMRGGMRDREEVRAMGERDRDASWEERQKRKREEFLSICAKAWDLLHAD